VSSSQEIRSDGWQRDVAVLRRQVADQQHEIERLRQVAGQERISALVSRWREAAASLAESNALWSSHFYDCASELERVLEATS
jgi:hypothetical protein